MYSTKNMKTKIVTFVFRFIKNPSLYISGILVREVSNNLYCKKEL